MHAYTDKNQSKVHQLVSTHFSDSKRPNATTVQFKDQRSETVIQRKLKGLAHQNTQSERIMQLQAIAHNNSINAQVQRQANRTGLPDQLKAGIEGLSGYAMDDVRVHYNSDKPAQLQAHAYAQGTDIHLATGQEKHLPHEAWHVVQQKQGRVKPTLQMKAKINDDAVLEREADVMGAKAMQFAGKKNNDLKASAGFVPTIQRYTLDGNGARKVSRNGKYIVNVRANTHILYVRQGALPPRPRGVFTIGRTKRFFNTQYVAYSFNQVRPDCLAFAEELASGIANRRYQPNQCTFRADERAQGTANRLFGSSDQQNMSIARGNFNRGDNAKPRIGQAYATVRPVIRAGKMPYHAATVVATDGSDRITCEADASRPNAKPVFDMYGTYQGRTLQGKSFHQTYKKYYSSGRGNQAATGVLKPK